MIRVARTTPIAAQVSVPAGPASVLRPGIPVLLATTVAQARAATGLAVVQAKAASIVRAVIIMGSAVVGTVTVAQATAPTDIAVIPALPMSTGCAAQVISCVMGIAVGPLPADAAPAVAPTKAASVVGAVVMLLLPVVVRAMLSVARTTAATDIAVATHLIDVSVGFACTDDNTYHHTHY